MPLKASDLHQCILCPYKSIRKDMKKHLTSVGKKGIRCTGLKKVIPSDVWENQILQFYTNDAPRPDLNQFMRKSPKGQRKRKPIQQLPSYKLKSPIGNRKRKPIKEIPRRDRQIY